MFGHYPLNTVVHPDGDTRRALRLTRVLQRHRVSAYLSGHLHSLFGPQLYGRHLELREWELTDWKVQVPRPRCENRETNESDFEACSFWILGVFLYSAYFVSLLTLSEARIEAHRRQTLTSPQLSPDC